MRGLQVGESRKITCFLFDCRFPSSGEVSMSLFRPNRRWSLLPAVCVLLGILAHAGRAQEPIRALLVLGGCCHDYKTQQTLITEGVSKRANVQWRIAYDPDTGTKHLNPIYESDEWSNGFDVVVHDECCSDVKDPAIIRRILGPHGKGLPAVLLHCGMHSYRSEGYPQATPWFDFTGASTGHGPQVPIQLTFTDKSSPITRGMHDWTTIKEELYNNSAGKLIETASPLATGKQIYKSRDGKEITAEAIVAWTNIYKSNTRVFATSLGHNNETVGDDRYLDLVTRGLLWSVNKLDESHLKPAKQVLLVK
jgi:Trehalose utilisation